MLALSVSVHLAHVRVLAEVRKELERIALEEGTSVEALLQAEKQEAAASSSLESSSKSDEFAEEDGESLPVKDEPEDAREHLNVVFIGHVGTF